MCAIFGSSELSKFKSLYLSNVHRGDFAFGGVFLGRSHGGDIIKVPGVYDFSQNIESVSYFNGHTQAPTSTAQRFNSGTSHPFIYNDWVVCHNGIITNYKKLKSTLPEEAVNVVDSSIIPVMLSIECNKYTLIAGIKKVLSQIEGTHATSLYNRTYNRLFIARCGSTLHVDKDDYSSSAFEGSSEVVDGSLLELVDSTFKVIGQFKNNSPFFLL